MPVANASGDVDLDLHDDDGPTRPLRDRTTRLTTPKTTGVRVLWAAAYWLSIALLVLVTVLVSLDVQR